MFLITTLDHCRRTV